MNKLTEIPDGGFVTGAKVALVSKLLENHPHLQTGTIAGILVAEAEKALRYSTHEITGAIAQIAAHQAEVENSHHQELLEQSNELNDLATSLVDSARTSSRDAEFSQTESKLQSIAVTSPEFQKSHQVIPDAELYALLQYLTKFHRSDFSRANPLNPTDLWKYRAAMTLALGPEHDYGIDRLPVEDTDIDFDADFTETPSPKPKTIILNLLRREYLRQLAKS